MGFGALPFPPRNSGLAHFGFCFIGELLSKVRFSQLSGCAHIGDCFRSMFKSFWDSSEAAFCNHVLRIIFRGSAEQMARSNAGWIVTLMANLFCVFRDGTVCENP